MESSECKRICTALFDKLLRDKFELNNEQSEALLKYLDGSQDKGVAKILNTPFFANLLVNALQNSRQASISVKIFLSKLICTVLSNEILFNRFVQMQGFELLVVRGYAELAVPDASPELLLAITQQAMALVAHYSGIKHVVDSNLFQKIMTPYTHHKPPDVADITYLFMAKLTWKLNEYEEEAALLKVLNYIITPLITSPLTTGTADPDSLVSCSESLLPFVHTLVYILGEVEHLMVPNNVVLILSNVFMIECKLTRAMERTPDPVLVRLLAEATVRFYYAASRQVALLCPDTETRVNQKFYEAVNKILCMLIKTCSYPTILKFLCHCHAFSYKVETIEPPVVVEKFMENYFILLILIPLFVRQLLFKKIVNDPTIEETKEIFLSDVAQSVPPDSIRLAYDLRKLIYESMDLTSACNHSMKELLQLKRLLSRQQAGLVFQTLFYTLNQFVLCDGSDLVLLANPLQTPEEELLLTKILDAIAMLLDQHVINWHESLEVVELQAALVNLVKQNILPVKLLVQAVELMTTSVRNLLSPELTLLMESQRGGSLREVAGAAGVLLGRPEGVARCAALQLILSFLEIAYVKFMPLRAVISAHRLVVGAARCALSDKELRTQAAALRCLAAAARCEDLWTELLENCDTLYEQLVNTMRCNSDGEVRKEATTVLAEVYTNRKVTEAFTTYVSKAMAKVATEDPHWPVRTAALRFWKQYIEYQFTDRGMIDGTFPSVTFCKEKRKIVALKDKEIYKLLDIAMNHLSASGCLRVLLKCLESSNHEKVIEVTFSLTDKLIELLDCYKYSGVSNVAQNSETVASCASVSPQRVDIKRAQSVLEDVDIIAEIFGSLGSESLKSEGVGPIEVVQPKDFIHALREARKPRPAKGDLSSLIREILAS